MHVLSQPDLDLMKFCSHAIPSGLALKLEAPSSRVSANEDEPQELEGFRPAEPAPTPSFIRVTPELDQPRLLPVQFKSEVLEPHSHGVPEQPRIDLLLEAQDDIIGIADDDHLASRLGTTPAVGPEVEDVMQEHVRQER